MNKRLTLSLVPLALLLIGAGCQSIYKNTEPVSQPAPTPLTSSSTPETAADELKLKVDVLNPGIVKLTWNAPKDMDTKTETFLLLHSTKDTPVYPGAFWFRKSGVDHEAAWGNIPSGKRYFRVCESKNDQCVKYSQVVEVDVK